MSIETPRLHLAKTIVLRTLKTSENPEISLKLHKRKKGDTNKIVSYSSSLTGVGNRVQ